jgi:hypothetical protein
MEMLRIDKLEKLADFTYEKLSRCQSFNLLTFYNDLYLQFKEILRFSSEVIKEQKPYFSAVSMDASNFTVYQALGSLDYLRVLINIEKTRTEVDISRDSVKKERKDIIKN